MKKKIKKIKKFTLKLYVNILHGICRLFKVRFQELENVRGIGHQVLEPLSFHIERKLKLNPYRMIYFFSNGGNPSMVSLHNHSLMGYWKKNYLTYTYEYSDKFWEKIKYKCFEPLIYPQRFELDPKYSLLIKPWRYVLTKKESNTTFELVNYYNKQPLQLTRKHAAKGEKVLKKWGITKKDWFVIFHSRDHTYYRNHPYQAIGDFEMASYVHRNTNVEDYALAIQEVGRRGGYCIRIGDQKIDPLPDSLKKLDYVIDYPKTEFVSDEMDVFLAARCRFIIGCNSGPIYLPGAFGKPAVAVQVSPCFGLPAFRRDLALPKWYWFNEEGRYLSLKEMFSPPYCYCYTDQDFKDRGIEAQNNTPEEILDIVTEMLDRLDSKKTYSKDEQRLHEKFKSSIDSRCITYAYRGQLGIEYLKTILNESPTEIRDTSRIN